MLILTGANSDKARHIDGSIVQGFSFRQVIFETVRKAEECGYRSLVYDLGSLGMGEPLPMKDVTKNAVFKPKIIKMGIEKYNDIIVYIDADAQLCGAIDEIADDDYDIGVTLRSSKEVDNDWYRSNFEWVKYINAGVIFFKPTVVTKEFVERWEKTTEEVGDDQVALNRLACPDEYPEPGSIVTMNGVRIKFFPCMQYNYYYFNEDWEDNIKIMHFKGDVRHYFPFTWKKRIYCRHIVPVLNRVKPVAKRLLKR